jgi:hypothetical protein
VGRKCEGKSTMVIIATDGRSKNGGEKWVEDGIGFIGLTIGPSHVSGNSE